MAEKTVEFWPKEGRKKQRKEQREEKDGRKGRWRKEGRKVEQRRKEGGIGKEGRKVGEGTKKGRAVKEGRKEARKQGRYLAGRAIAGDALVHDAHVVRRGKFTLACGPRVNLCVVDAPLFLDPVIAVQVEEGKVNIVEGQRRPVLLEGEGVVRRPPVGPFRRVDELAKIPREADVRGVVGVAVVLGRLEGPGG
jgi:hypothetical protein